MFLSFAALTIDNAQGRIYSEDGADIRIDGNVTISNALTATGFYLQDGTQIGGPGGGSLAWQENANGIHYSDGNVGIGDSTPDAALVIKETNSQISEDVTDLVNNGTFTGSAEIWTLGTGWSYNDNNIIHAAGNTEALTQNIGATDTASLYRVSLNVVSKTAGGVTISMGSSTYVSSTGASTIYVSGVFTGVLSIIPDSTFDGVMDDISVVKVFPTAAAIKLLNSDGVASLDIRAGGTSIENTFIGLNSGASTTTGIRNTALGHDAMRWNMTGSHNVAIGKESLLLNKSGESNVAVGRSALESNTSGSSNTALGDVSLERNTTGNYNVAVGKQASFMNVSGCNNTSIGYRSMNNNEVGYDNVAIGYNVMQAADSSTFNDNVAIGAEAMGWATGGRYNTAIGSESLESNTTGQQNTAIGYKTMNASKTASYNVAVGSYALHSNTANENLAVGRMSLYANTSGTRNIGIGQSALFQNVSGGSNIAVGYNALAYNLSNRNIAIGVTALEDNKDTSDNIAIGVSALNKHLTGSGNVAVGSNGLLYHQDGGGNTCIGNNSGDALVTGEGNIAVGQHSLSTTTTGDGNISIGKYSLYGVETGSNNIAIGDFAGFDETGSDKLYISNSKATKDAALIYGEFSRTTETPFADPTQQKLRFNANVEISEGLSVNGDLSVSGTFGVPISATPSVNNSGEMAVDLDDNAVVYNVGDGTDIPSNTIVAQPLIQQKDVLLMEPEKMQAVSDAIPIFTVDPINFPKGIVITAIKLSTSANCTMTLTLEEWSDPSTFVSAIEPVALSSANEITVSRTDIDDSEVAVGGYVFANLDTTAVIWLKITIWYYVKG